MLQCVFPWKDRTSTFISNRIDHICLSALPAVQTGQRPAAAVRGSAPPGSPRQVAPLKPQQEQQESLQREKEEAQQKERERQAEEREKEERREEVRRGDEREICGIFVVLFCLFVLFLNYVPFFVSKVQRLQGRCEQQERQLRSLREELRKTSLGLEAFIITTQHYCLKVASLNNTRPTLNKSNIVLHYNNDTLHVLVQRCSK